MEKPEIVIGLVGALGTDLDSVAEELETALDQVRYRCQRIRLSELLGSVSDICGLPEAPLDSEAERLDAYMTAGNTLRKALNSGSALALLAVLKIRELRFQAPAGNSDIPLQNTALVLRSLKHPDEVRLLREIYGPSFFLVSAYTPRKTRLANLERKLDRFHPDRATQTAVRLVDRDEAEPSDSLGQHVRKTFWRGDVFVDASDRHRLSEAVKRVVQLWFGHPFQTPARDEYLMFCARAAAYRSASLGRQVGAVLATADGSLLATGTNEVPKSGGGQYWHGDAHDARDHTWGYDSSDDMRKALLRDILIRLNYATETDQLVENLLYGEKPVMVDAEFWASTEYQRAVHAEMSAITDAVRRGVSVNRATLYTTTFPCHGCTKHIVASGITRVVYIEPYAKSLARTLHSDSISVEGDRDEGADVIFEPYVGVAPERYLSLFAMGDRKDDHGNILKWDPGAALPRIEGWVHKLTVTNEQNAVRFYGERTAAAADRPDLAQGGVLP